MLRGRSLKHIAAVLTLTFILNVAWAGPASEMSQLTQKVEKSWTTSGETITRTVTGEDGTIVSQRTYDKATGKFLYEGAPTEGQAKPRLEEAPVAPAAPVKTEAAPVAEPKKEEAKADAGKKAAVWENKVVIEGLVSDSSDNRDHTYEEFVNKDSGIGIKQLDIARFTDQRLFRLNLESFGTWNHTFDSRLDYRHQDEVKVKARFSRLDWNYGTVEEPSTFRSTFSLDASLNRPELSWHPYVTFSYRGEEINGDHLRYQGNPDLNYPRGRTQEFLEPGNREINLAVSGSRKNLDLSLVYGEQYSEDSTRKIYQRDVDFNGLKDAMDLWKYNLNFARTTAGKAKYRFNDRYSLALGVTTTSTDNEFDTARKLNSPSFASAVLGNTFGYHNQDHGWVDGFTRLEELVFEGRPNDKWDVEGRIERRTMRTRADGSLRYYDTFGNLLTSDDGTTDNRVDEGYMEVRADYYGWKNTPVYVGYRYTQREENDDDTLGTFGYDVSLNKTFVPSQRAVDRLVNYEQTERMGYVGVRHRFDKIWDVDVRHESGSIDDDHSGSTGRDISTIMQNHDRIRQSMTLRAKPEKDISLLLKLRCDRTEYDAIGTEDRRRAAGFYANWTPGQRKFTIGSGYTWTLGKFSLPTAAFEDQMETYQVNGTYRFCTKLSAALNYSQSVSGDVSRQDYRIGELRLIHKVGKDQEATLGYAQRQYENLNLASEDFVNHMFTLSYELPL